MFKKNAHVAVKVAISEENDEMCLPDIKDNEGSFWGMFDASYCRKVLSYKMIDENVNISNTLVQEIARRLNSQVVPEYCEQGYNFPLKPSDHSDFLLNRIHILGSFQI